MRRTFVVALVAAFACNKAAPQVTEEAKPAPAPLPATAPTEPPVAAKDPWLEQTKPVAKDPLARPFFWSASKDGKTTYFLGTMHMGVDAEARLPKLVWDKLAAAPALAVETDATDPAIIGMGQRKSGTLRAELGPTYWKKLEALVEPRLLQGLDKMKPAITVAMLSMRGLPRTPPMDGILLLRAKEANKDIVYLEAATKQAALLDKWLDIRALKSMLDDPEKGLENTKAMLDAYLSGDEAKMIELANTQKAEQLKSGISEKEYEQSVDEMLYQRNASWIAAIEKLHARGNAFVAVGALHLVGPKSVLELLQARGYKIARVQP